MVSMFLSRISRVGSFWSAAAIHRDQRKLLVRSLSFVPPPCVATALGGGRGREALRLVTQQTTYGARLAAGSVQKRPRTRPCTNEAKSAHHDSSYLAVAGKLEE